jgi:hypothetical protein
MGRDLIFGLSTLVQTEYYTSSSGIAGAAVEISFLFYIQSMIVEMGAMLSAYFSRNIDRNFA